MVGAAPLSTEVAKQFVKLLPPNASMGQGESKLSSVDHGLIWFPRVWYDRNVYGRVYAAD